MDPSNWEQYDIDWPPFGPNNYNYLNIGIPPVVSKNYRQQYMNFWNQNLNEKLTGDQQPTQTSSESTSYDNSTTFIKPKVPHVLYYSDKTTENPIRQLQYLLHRTVPNRSDMYQTQSTVEMPKIIYDSASASPENTFVLGENKIVVKADSTLNVLIAMVIIFLLINIIVISVYVVRRNYFKRNLKRKLDVLSIDGTTDDDLKRSNKCNDGDESFILDIVRRKNEYVPVKRYHSPINGFLLSRHYSTSTVDTHTKVSDWITQEVNRQSPNFRSKSPSFSFNTSNLITNKKLDKVNVGVDATPCTFNGNILQPMPIELMKSKSCEIKSNGIFYPNLVNNNLANGNAHSLQQNDGPASAKNSMNCVSRMDHHSYTNSDPSIVQFKQPKQSTEQITSFIEDVDVNVTSRDECDGASNFPLSPEETLQIYQMRNYPKVLPKYPNTSSEYVSTSSFKRRSMPSYQHLVHSYARVPPVPPPRTSSTLDRKLSFKRTDSDPTEHYVLTPTMALPFPDPSSPSTIDEEPEISYNELHVGPLLPGSKENLYSTVNRKRQLPLTENKSCIVQAQIETPTNETNPLTQNHKTQSQSAATKQNGESMPMITQPKSIMKRPWIRDNSSEHLDTSSQVLSSVTSSKIPIFKLRTSGNSNCSSGSCSSSSGNTANNSDNKSDRDPSPDESIINNVRDSIVEIKNELTRSAASLSTETSSSSAETIKQIF